MTNASQNSDKEFTTVVTPGRFRTEWNFYGLVKGATLHARRRGRGPAAQFARIPQGTPNGVRQSLPTLH